MFYIYILYSESADKYYVGLTDQPERRLFEHNHADYAHSGKTFTAKARPWKIVALFQCSEIRGEAMKMEALIKKQKNRTFIERLIRGEELSGELAQLVRVPHLRD